MAARDKPAAEVRIDVDLVRCLLSEQHADLAGLPIVEMAEGWDNVMFRVGDDVAVRLPRRRVAADLIAHEQRWLPGLAPLLPSRIPAPLRSGSPGCGFPWSWSVLPWLQGEVLGARTVHDPDALAVDLGAFLAALHRPAPDNAPTNVFRGVPLSDRGDRLTEAIDDVADTLDAPFILDLWARAIDVPPWAGEPVWVHGDVHPLNLLVDEHEKLAAVIDFGDLTSGDPSTDLAVAWTIFEAEQRSLFRASCSVDVEPVDDDTWARAWGWALNYAVLYVANSADVPVLGEIGRQSLRRLLADIVV